VPGWHAKTLEAQRAGRLQLVGVIQEQHADRCRLFMQWKRMDWPVLVDSLNLAGIDVVPVAYAIDERGVVRHVNPSEDELRAFLDSPPPPAAVAPSSGGPPDLDELRVLTRSDDAASWRAYGDGLFLWGGEDRLGEAVEAYETASRIDPGDGPTQFRLGAAYRRRYDSSRRRPGDFQRAAERWARAVELDPNQYIWRRRLQQYGPRLDKPYPFYDWVEEARREVRARGEEPAPLLVEPGGAEIASPAERFEAEPASGTEPDPGGRIRRDPGRFVGIEAAVVPPKVRPGGVARVHLVFRAEPAVDAHWNNEGGPLRVWVQPPRGWAVDRRDLRSPSPPEVVSTERREIQFELRAPEDAAGSAAVPAYALYYVCSGATGTCLYRRQDVSVTVDVRP
jgi:hypothetical protein